MIKGTRTLVTLVTAGIAFAGLAKPADAQLGWTFVGVGGYDTDDVYLALGGVSVSPRREGWAPIAGVNVIWLQYPISTTTNAHRNVTAVTPSIGIKNTFTGGSVSAKVGYSFSNATDDSPVPVFTSQGGDGIVNSFQLDYWGTGSWSAQGLADYNYGSESFFGRGRVGRRILAVGDQGHLSLGAEAAYLESRDYSATKIGGVIGLNPGPGTQINAAIGRKFGGTNSGDANYFSVELVLYPH